MTDQEKIMSWLEGLSQDDWHQFHSDSEVSNIAKAALALLKEHEAVVRCKDCEHSEPWYGDKSRCFLWHETGIDVFNDGFCNYGKRKEGR